MPPRAPKRRRLHRQRVPCGPPSLDQVLEAEQLRARLAHEVAAAAGDLQLTLRAPGALDHAVRCSARPLRLTVDAEDPRACAAGVANLRHLQQATARTEQQPDVHLVLRGGPEACGVFLDSAAQSQLPGGFQQHSYSRVTALTARLCQLALQHLRLFPRLARLDASHSTLTELELRAVGQQHVEHLILERCDAMARLNVTGATRLRTLRLLHTHQVTELAGLADAAPTLAHFDFRRNVMHRFPLPELQQLINVETLLGWCGDGQAWRTTLNLTLEYPRVRRFSADLYNLQTLLSIQARGHPTLEELSVGGVYGVDAVDVRDSGVEVIRIDGGMRQTALHTTGCAMLQHVVYTENRFARELVLRDLPRLGFLDVSNCSALERVDVRGCPRLAMVGTLGCLQEPVITADVEGGRRIQVVGTMDHMEDGDVPEPYRAPKSMLSDQLVQDEIKRVAQQRAGEVHAQWNVWWAAVQQHIQHHMAAGQARWDWPKVLLELLGPETGGKCVDGIRWFYASLFERRMVGNRDTA